ncbi:MAG: hypothetical protein HQL46_15605 [Gammaproteobacteria bacterium]|nr:hypothetical protein [Gammaproteobacteria bacterium]
MHLYSDSPYHRLQYFRYALNLYQSEAAESQKYKLSLKAHDAISDVLIMKLLLAQLVSQVKKNYPDIEPYIKLEELTRTPVLVKKFKFGKYKGKNIKDVYQQEPGYINWLIEKATIDDDLKYTLNQLAIT